MKYDIQSLKEKLLMLDVRPNKKLGQNFLINKNVCEKIVDKSLGYNIRQIVEVGPGLGALTEVLLEKGVSPTLIELDRSFAQYWQEKGLKIFHKDALQMDWAEFEGYVLVSNLPYQISSSLVIERSLDVRPVQAMVLMFQKEVAQRMVAKPKTADYGMLSVIAQIFWKVDFFMEVGPKDFYPPPSIASRVLSFERKVSQLENPQKFLSFVKESFKQRRKLLVSNIAGLVPKEKSKAMLLAMGFTEMARPEELSPQQFLDFFNNIC